MAFGPGCDVRLSSLLQPRPQRPCRKTGLGEAGLTYHGITALWRFA